MSDNDSPEDSGGGDHPENRGPRPNDPLQGSFQVSHHTARLPESIGSGVFANALMVLSGQLEVILDFVQRIHEPNRVVSRVILSPVVARQFVATLKQNIDRYEEVFGSLPKLRQPLLNTSDAPSTPEFESKTVQPSFGAMPPEEKIVGPGLPDGGVASQAASGDLDVPRPVEIDDIYDDLRLDDEMLSGRYANAVIVRHSAAEFAFDFITRFVPHSAVSARIIVAAPNVANMLHSLDASVGKP